MGAARSIPRFRAGERLTGPGGVLTAARLNQLVDAINAMGSITGGPGVRVSSGAGGVVVSLDLAMLRGPTVAGRISAVTGGAGPAASSTFTYNFTAFARPELPVYSGLTPAGGRPVLASDTTTEIYPSPVDSWAILILEPNGDGTTTPRLHLLVEEVLAVEDCAAAAQSEPASLPLDDLLDQVLVGIDWSVIAGIRRELATTFLVNDAQTALYITPAVLGIDGEPAVGIDHTILTSFDADPDATDLWDAVAVTSDGHPIVGIDHTLTLSALI